MIMKQGDSPDGEIARFDGVNGDRMWSLTAAACDNY